jgi:hypothetical protein
VNALIPAGLESSALMCVVRARSPHVAEQRVLAQIPNSGPKLQPSCSRLSTLRCWHAHCCRYTRSPGRKRNVSCGCADNHRCEGRHEHEDEFGVGSWHDLAGGSSRWLRR